MLTALAKNVKNLKTFNPKQDMEITHWFLNKQDITKAVYLNGDRNIDEATTSTRLKTVIEGFHRRFISGNPINVDADALRKEIDAMAIDLSDVVFGGNSKTEESNNELNATTEELTLSMSNIMETEGKNVDALKVFFREHLSGKYVNTVIGKVWFTKKETEHKFRGNVHRNDLTLKIIPYTIDILKNGNYLGRAELHKDRSDGIVGFHVFEKELNIDNLIIMTEIDVAESDPKQYTYNITHEKAIGWKKRKENATYSASYRQSTSINTIMPKEEENVNLDSIGEVDDRWEAYDDPYSSIHIMSARDKNGKLLSPEEVMAIFNAKENDQKLTTTAQPLQNMPQVQEETDYTINLPAGSEKYITAIKGAFAEDSELRELNVSFKVGGVAMDAIEKSQIAIEGESSKIKTRMAQTIYFASIGHDKIDGKDGARMPSVSLIKNAEYIKEKTGVDYAINHYQTATFETAKVEVNFDGQKAYSLFLPIGKFETWSVKERWLSSAMNRKGAIEYILEQLRDEAKGNAAATKTEEPKAEADSELKSKLEAIKPFMGEAQYSILKSAVNGPDNEFEDVINDLYQIITTMPKTYEQDGKGDQAVAYLHYFKGGSDWWITEKDMGDQQEQAFGLASINGYEPELGYISIVELTENDIELDFYWEPKTVGEIKGQDEDEDDEETQGEESNLEEREMEIKDEETATEAPTDYSKYKGALSRIIAASIETIEEVETDIEIIENAYNANPDDEELKNIYQQVLNKLDEMAGI